MPYIGKNPVGGGFHKLDALTASATATYALTLNSAAYYPESANQLLVSLNGVIQAPQDSFTVSGSNLVFDTALTTSDSIDFVVALGDVLAVKTVTDGAITTAKLGNGAVTKAKMGTTELDLATIKDSTGTNTAMTIDSSGRIATPQRVRFHAYLNANTTTTAVGQNKWSASSIFNNNVDQIVYNVGNGYDSSTTTFTAPVDGLYCFTVKLTTSGSGSTQSYMGCELYINNVRHDSGWERADSVGYHKQQESFLVYCTANDTIEPGLEIANNTNFTGGTSSTVQYNTYFNGYLIG